MRTSIVWAGLLVGSLAAQGRVELAQGPFVGHVTTNSAKVWARASSAGTLRIEPLGDPAFDAVEREAHADRDHCVVFDVVGLKPGRAYRYRIVDAASGGVSSEGEDHVLRAARPDSADGTTRLCFGSCAREDDATARVWDRIATERVDALVLLGDTPYIDTTKLATQRRRYAAFADVEEFAALVRSTSWYGTWDDHDFGANDTDGRLEGRRSSRRAFVEYHANPSYGDDGHGIYTKFRRGPFEVYLLDARYFAAREPSPFLGHAASLLGAKQWKWLRRSLKASRAPVKVLACGMIWNEATRPGKRDHWGSYPHERDALFAFLGKHEIGGVVLVGGDIHRSRVVRHATEAVAGYDIVELISSPLHSGIIESANAPHPGLLADMGEPHTYLLLEATQRDGELDGLRARFRNASGDEHFAIDL